MEQDFHGKFRVHVPVPGSQIVGKTRKWKEREKLGAGKRKKEGCSHFLNSTISEPGIQATFSPVYLTESCSLSYGAKDLLTLQKLDDKVVLDHQNWWRHKR